MTMYTVYGQFALRRYFAPFLSGAMAFRFLSFIFVIIAPLIFAYKTHMFYQKEDSYLEMPKYQFNKGLLVVVQTTSQQYSWSTLPAVNTANGNVNRFALLQSANLDLNGDGDIDQSQVNIKFPMSDAEDILAVDLLLVFQVNTLQRVNLAMQTLAHLHYASGSPGASWNVSGILRIHQKTVLSYRGEKSYTTSPFPLASSDPTDLQLPNILREYSKRNVTTVFQESYSIWTPNRSPGAPFTISATVNFVPHQFRYTPTLWYVAKVAWIQYLALFYLFHYFHQLLCEFVFRRQLFTTWVTSDLMGPIKTA